MTTSKFFEKLRDRQKEENERLYEEVSSKRISFDIDPDLSDYFFDTQKRVFMKFDDSGRTTEQLTELEVARLKKYVVANGIVL